MTTTYIDRKIGFQRTYSLGADTLVVEGKRWFGGAFRQEFQLRKLKPEPDEHRIRDDSDSALAGMPGLGVFLVGAILGPFIYERTPRGFYAVLSVGLAAMIIGLVLGGRVTVLVFKSRDELPLIEVACRRRKAAEFEQFIGELKTRIRAASEQAKES